MKPTIKEEITNQFWGMSKSLDMYQNAPKGMPFDWDAAWNEADTPEKKQMVTALSFAIGDIPNRQHYLFESKVDDGGFGQRETFRDTILPKLYKKIHHTKRVNFLMMVIEYTTADNIFAMRVKTDKKGKVLKVINMPMVFGFDNVAKVALRLSRGTEFQKYLLATYLTLPQYKPKSTDGKVNAKMKTELLKTISELLGWKVVENKKYKETGGAKISFPGFKEFRQSVKRFKEKESVLFSTGRILSYDTETFLTWLNGTPGDARNRVKNKIKTKDDRPKKEKYTKLVVNFKQWESFKTDKQKEQRDLEEKKRRAGVTTRGLATTDEWTEEDEIKLQKVKQEAKVTIGSNRDFEKQFENIIMGTSDDLAFQSFVDTISINTRSVVAIDSSGSMMGMWGHGLKYPPIKFATFLLTAMLLKSPEDDVNDFFISFDSTAKVHHQVSALLYAKDRNRPLLKVNPRPVSMPLVDRTLSFRENYERLNAYCSGTFRGGSTNLDSIPKALKQWVQEDPVAQEYLQSIPLWFILSDGVFNNSYGVANSILSFQRQFRDICGGYCPFLAIIDVAKTSSAKIRQMEGVDNCIYIPYNINNIQMILKNFKTGETFDTYTPLKIFFESNRYAPVRALI